MKHRDRKLPHHIKLSSDELVAYLHAKKSGHIHKDKSKTIQRKLKYNKKEES